MSHNNKQYDYMYEIMKESMFMYEDQFLKNNLQILFIQEENEHLVT